MTDTRSAGAHGGAAPGPVLTALRLPDGFQPESVTIGAEPVAWFGSLADGSLHRLDLVTGVGRTLGPGPGTPAAGVRVDGRGRVFVAGAFAGDARVVDGETGEILADYRLAADGPTLVADVVLTPDGAWFTDALAPVLYHLPLGPDGALPGPGDVRRVPLTGDLVYTEGLNVMGAERTPDGTALLIVQANEGVLFRVDPRTGTTTRVGLGGETLRADGLALSGTRLYGAVGIEHHLAEVRLDAAGTRGEVVRRVKDERFDAPSAVAVFGDRLYVPNSRINMTVPTPATPYEVLVLPVP
ncbi:superoxide dismutase [Streptomyces ficellus]|uniref:Superoxide dismutase n=1 Tax=Streptomyces ficellus TaxID=1977088 RepID=A0A6I6FBG4_9ACTN|nr:superoxide dismutase [Streptomyces ficellus]QGV77512.1 superoxide dismutase [Streptomyces ficellus]